MDSNSKISSRHIWFSICWSWWEQGQWSDVDGNQGTVGLAGVGQWVLFCCFMATAQGHCLGSSTPTLFIFLIGVWLLYNVLVSAGQQSESVICIHMSPLLDLPLPPLHPSRSSQSTELSFCASGSFPLAVCFAHSVYVKPHLPICPTLPFLPCVHTRVCWQSYREV